VSVLYTASALSTGDGRNGHVRSSDGLLDLDLAAPAEMGGAGGATNPEQLFAAGYAACFHSAIKGVARRQKVTLGPSTVAADVGIGPRDAGGFGLTVALHVEIDSKVSLITQEDRSYGIAAELHVNLPSVEDAEAIEIVREAHQVCPYSNATRGNIDVAIDATVT